MSWRSDTAQLTSGWTSSLYAGHGILGGDVPTSGTQDRPSLIYSTFDGNLNVSAEYRLLGVSVPAGFTLAEDGSGSFSGESGGVMTFRPFVDGSEQ